MKKNGFTLIELLAVIVILAVIALITVPAVMNVVADAKKSAAIDAAYGYVKAVELDMAIKVGKGDETVVLDYSTNGFTNTGVSVRGTKPTAVALTIENGEVISGTMTISSSVVTFSAGKASI